MMTLWQRFSARDQISLLLLAGVLVIYLAYMLVWSPLVTLRDDMARRKRGFISGSGAPILAATVISFASLEKIFERFLSCAPLRCMMFLNLLWPAIVLRPSLSPRSPMTVLGAVGVCVRISRAWH